MIKIQFYVSPNGKNAVASWLDSLSRLNRNRIAARLDRIAMGNLGDYKAVGDGVFEFRFDFATGYRIYFAWDGKEIILLLQGGDKSTQNKDIRKAKERWQDYQKRKQGH